MSESNQDVALKDIELAVAKDRDGRLDVPARLKARDEHLGEELIIIALYKAFTRRGLKHAEAVKYTKDLLFITNVQVIYG